MDQENRVVVLVDMDCFYCQVEEKLNPELKGKPIAVVQYNPWKGGGIIAVNYVARAHGVTRNMRGDEAREKCPDIELPSVPCQRGKADITKYRDAGKEVARVLQRFTTLLERASIDEAYLDITAPVQERLKTLNVNTISAELMPNTYALGYDCVEEFLADVHTCGMDNIEFDYEHAKRLLVGAVIVSEIRAAVYSETGYRCSAGISHNKILAKLVCGMNKPNKQTVLPKHSINILYKTLSVKKVKHLGGKFGDTVCKVLKISKMGELQSFSEKDLQARFDEKNGTWLYNIARGIDLEPVQARFNPKSIGCCKQFRGKAALLDLESLRKWLKDLGDEIDDRLEKDALENNRTPKQMVVSYSTQMPDGRDSSSSRSYNFVADDELCGEMFSGKALELVLESSEGLKVADCDGNRKLKCPIKFLGISVGKFEDISEIKKTKKILDYFGAGSSKDIIDKPKENMKPENKNNENDNLHENTKTKNIKNHGKDYIMQKFLAKQVTNKTDIQTNISNKPDSNLTETSNTTETRNENPVNDIMQKFLTKEVASKTIIQTNNSNKSDSNLNEANNTTEHESRNEMSGDNIMQKFLAKQVTTKRTNQSNDFNNLNRVLDKASNEHDNGKCTNDKILESSLAKQESFFAKILNKNQKKELQVELQNEQLKPTTPVCDVIKYGEDSNDTDYSSSTINNEIDKSMALFDEDPDDVARLTNIRQLMNSSRIINEEETETISEPDENPSPSPEPVIEIPVETLSTVVFPVKDTETFNCTECGKTISIDMVAEHSDYHLALKLREEERQQVRKEIREKNANVTLKVEQNDKAKKKVAEEQSSIRNESMSSITSFLVKIDDTVPTEICSECGRKVPLAKFGEHLDFHEAKKLSRELNKKTNPQFTGSSVKRKRKSASPIKKNKMPCKSIDSFFR